MEDGFLIGQKDQDQAREVGGSEIMYYSQWDLSF